MIDQDAKYWKAVAEQERKTANEMTRLAAERNVTIAELQRENRALKEAIEKAAATIEGLSRRMLSPG